MFNYLKVVLRNSYNYFWKIERCLSIRYLLDIPLVLKVCTLNVSVMKATSVSCKMLLFAQGIFRNLKNVYELLVGPLPPFWGSAKITSLGMSVRNFWFNGWCVGYFVFSRDFFYFQVVGAGCPGCYSVCPPGLCSCTSPPWALSEAG